MDSLWVFGYGSLCWLPGFTYGDSVVGHIQGFARRFWQGNATHRGTKEKASYKMIGSISSKFLFEIGTNA